MTQTSMPEPDSGRDLVARELGAGVTVAVPGRSLGRLLGFVNQIVMARLLGAPVFGLFSIGWSFLRALTLLAPLGMDAAILRFGAGFWPGESGRIRSVLVRVLRVGLASALLVGVAVIVGADGLARVVFQKPALAPILRVVGMAIPLAAALRILASSTSLTRRQHYMVLTEELAQPVLQLILFIALWYAMLPGLDAALVAVMASVLLATCAAGAIANRLFGTSQQERTSPAVPVTALLAFSFPVALGGFLGSFLLWADRLLVGALGTERDAGVYAIISLVSVVFATLLSGFKSSLAPMAAALHASGRKEELADAYRLSTRWSQYLAIPFFLFLASSGKELLAWGLGPEYEAGFVPMLILSVGQLVNASTGPADTLLVMGGYPRRWTALAGCGLMGLVVLAALWIPRWGLIGAALAAALAVVLVSVGALLAVWRSIGVQPFDRRTVRVILSGLAAAGALILVSRAGISATILRPGVNAIVSLSVFFGVLLGGGMPAEERAVLTLAGQRLRARREDRRRSSGD